MKNHLARLRIVVAITITCGVCQHQANAQYLPYRPAPQTVAPYGYQAATPQGQYAPQMQAAPQAYVPYQPQQQVAPQGQYTYQPAVQPQYPAVAQNPYGQTNSYPMVAQAPAPEQVLSNPPANGQSVSGESLPSPQNGMSVTNGQPTVGMPGDVYPQNGYMQDSMSGYPQTDAGNCAPYPATGNYGSYAGGYPDYGLGSYCDSSCGTGNQWFGGVYFLFMERDNNGFTRVSVQADPPTDPYYAPAATTVLSTDNVDYDFRQGLEVRFGSTFMVGAATDACNSYGCNTCAPSQLFAWEVGLWAIDDDIDWFTVTDDDMTDTYRVYGMVNYAGLHYDDGGGYRPVNEYYDYQMPIVDDNPAVAGDYRVFRQRIRTNFSASNVELNFLRFPVCDYASCGTCGTNGGYDASGYGYNACSSGYGAGCQTASCSSCGPAFSMAGMCGLRYFRMDDSFEHSVDAYSYDGAAWVDTTYEWDMFSDYNVDNHLFGFQLGMNMNYCVACKWNFFCDTAFGAYNNHINQYARIYGPTGPAYEIQSGREATINNDKNDIAFLGELRLGGAYDLSCNWRAVLAYRAVAISGVALATEQINPEMSNWSESSRIDSNSSIVIHGLQAGVECRY